MQQPQRVFFPARMLIDPQVVAVVGVDRTILVARILGGKELKLTRFGLQGLVQFFGRAG